MWQDHLYGFVTVWHAHAEGCEDYAIWAAKLHQALIYESVQHCWYIDRRKMGNRIWSRARLMNYPVLIPVCLAIMASPASKPHDWWLCILFQGWRGHHGALNPSLTSDNIKHFSGHVGCNPKHVPYLLHSSQNSLRVNVTHKPLKLTILRPLLCG